MWSSLPSLSNYPFDEHKRDTTSREMNDPQKAARDIQEEEIDALVSIYGVISPHSLSALCTRSPIESFPTAPTHTYPANKRNRNTLSIGRRVVCSVQHQTLSLFIQKHHDRVSPATIGGTPRALSIHQTFGQVVTPAEEIRL